MKMNKGMMALKKERPDVAEKMGFMYGGKVKKMMGGGMTMKDKKKMMGYMYGGKVKKMMGGGMTMKKMMDGGKTMKNKGFNPKCDGQVTRGRTRGTIV